MARSAFNQLGIDLGLAPEPPKPWAEMSSAEKSEAILRDNERREADLRFRVENFLKAARVLQQMVYGKEGFVNEFARDSILQIAPTPSERKLLEALFKRDRRGRLKSERALV